MADKGIISTIEEQRWLDQIADPVHRPIEGLLERSPGLRTLLSGTWLGHPVHPAVTDLPVGAWTTSFVLDLMDVLGANRQIRRCADVVQTIGLIGAGVAAIAGLADWSYTSNRARRVGVVHGLTNVTVASLYGASAIVRRRGNRNAGIGLSGLGFGLLVFGTWLGGSLAYRLGIGVNHAAFEEAPDRWQPVLADGQLREGELRRVETAGVPILLTRHQGQIYAIGDTCTHLGCSLSQGRKHGDLVICSCHGSHFRLTDGQVVAGPATVSERTFEVRTLNGQIEVRPATSEQEPGQREQPPAQPPMRPSEEQPHAP